MFKSFWGSLLGRFGLHASRASQNDQETDKKLPEKDQEEDQETGSLRRSSGMGATPFGGIPENKAGGLLFGFQGVPRRTPGSF